MKPISDFYKIAIRLSAILLRIGHYAKKGLKAATRPVNLIIAGVALKTLLSSFDAKAQIEADTLWGEGIFSAKNIENNAGVSNINLYLTPESMAMTTPDTTYEFITGTNGWAIFEEPGLPVYIDSTTGIRDLLQSESSVVPNFGSEMNAFFPQVQQGSIEVYNMAGQLVEKRDFHSDHEYLQLDNLATGMYVYNIRTTDGVELGGKFLKQDLPLKGPASRPSNATQSNLKSITNHEATYWAKWVDPEGNFYTDSTLVTIEEGNNGFVQLFMTPVGGNDPIDNQDISGIVVDPNNNYAALANASIEVYIPSTNQLFTTTSDSDGSFRIDGLPLGKEAYFSAGNISGKGSIVDFPFNTIEEVINPSDSINSNFGTVLPDNVPTSSWAHIGEINSQGTNQEIIKFYLGNSFNETQKNTIRGYYSQLQSDLNNSYIFVESSSQLEDEGINIEYGTYQTNTTVQTTVTPLGNSLYPVKYANSTMGVGDYVNFVHETFLALGYKGVGWYSVMRIDSPDFTLEDKDIAREISAMYWNAVYQDEKTYIPIDKIQENMSKSAGAKAKSNGEVKQENNQHH